MGFVTFILVGLLSFAYFYGSSVQDRIRMTQALNYGNKIISTAESVFYAGEPSKATIEVYLPDGVKEVQISGNEVAVSVRTSTGLNKLVFTSKVPLVGSLQSSQGIKKVELTADSESVLILQV
jgi:hypothetical protein